MKAKRISIKPGEIFAVPLIQGGYGIGLVVRKNKKVILGYFFNRVHQDFQSIAVEMEADKRNVIFIAKFSALDIESGVWPILGSLREFKVEEWPIPILRMQHAITNEFLAIVLAEDLLDETKRYKISEEEANRLYPAGLHGSVSLQIKLSNAFTLGLQ